MSESEQHTALAKTAALRFMVLFCPGISGLASPLSPFFNQLNGRLCLPRTPDVNQKGTQSRLLCTENCRRGTGKTATPATRVTLATCGAPPLEISWSMSNKNSSGKCGILILCAFTGSYNPELLVILLAKFLKPYSL